MNPTKTFSLLTTLVLAAGALAGCVGGDGDTGAGANTGAGSGGERLSGSIDITGSSTVYPAGQAWAEEFQAMHRDVRIAYNVLGTGGGFKAFCRGEADMTGASRPIKTGPESETEQCRASGIEPVQVQIGIDGLAVVVSKQNTFAQDITVEELNRIWTADASKQANRWNALRAEWPDQEIVRYGPGTDSGTYDYWKEAIIHPFDGSDATTRSDYTPSEDDNVLVQGIASSPYAIGFFGLAYVHENADKIRAVPVDEGKGKGAVEPTPENVASGEYSPLSRPLFYYTPGAPQGVLKAFLEYGLSEEGQMLVEEVGYIPLPADLLQANRAKVSGA
jgi:phosphate transport system substrate-binding protein